MWTKLFHQTHYLPQVLHHISDVVTAAVIISLTVFHRNYGFSSNQVKPLYFYGPYLGVSRPPSWFNYADELKQSLRVFQVSFPYGLPSTTSLLSYIPELTLNKLQEYLRSSTWNFLHNMPNPNSYLLFIAGQTFTSIVDLLQAYYQHPKEEYHLLATLTKTYDSIPIALHYSISEHTLLCLWW